jgi:hypothetical protein
VTPGGNRKLFPTSMRFFEERGQRSVQPGRAWGSLNHPPPAPGSAAHPLSFTAADSGVLGTICGNSSPKAPRGRSRLATGSFLTGAGSGWNTMSLRQEAAGWESGAQGWRGQKNSNGGRALQRDSKCAAAQGKGRHGVMHNEAVQGPQSYRSASTVCEVSQVKKHGRGCRHRAAVQMGRWAGALGAAGRQSPPTPPTHLPLSSLRSTCSVLYR